MNCKNLHKKILFYFDGELPEKEMKEVQEHLAECAFCAAFASEMEKTMKVLQTDQLQQVNPYFYTRVKARIKNQQLKKISFLKNPAFVRILQPVAFSLLLAAGIYAGIKIGTPAKPANANSVYAKTELIPYLNEMETETIETFLMQ